MDARTPRSVGRWRRRDGQSQTENRHNGCQTVGPLQACRLGGCKRSCLMPTSNVSARTLDPKRLGKQRVETLQVVRALTRPGYGWANHPAVLMWKGFEEALGRYGLTCCRAWTELGFGDTCAITIATDLRAAGVATVRTQAELAAAGALPPWLGDEAVHRSHRSALVRKDQAHYRPVFPDIPDDLPYVWPVRSQAAIAAEQRKAENKRGDANGRSSRRGWRPDDCISNEAGLRRRPGRHDARTPCRRQSAILEVRRMDDRVTAALQTGRPSRQARHCSRYPASRPVGAEPSLLLGRRHHHRVTPVIRHVRNRARAMKQTTYALPP